MEAQDVLAHLRAHYLDQQYDWLMRWEDDCGVMRV